MRNGMQPTDAANDALQRIIKKFPNFNGAIVVADKFGNHGILLECLFSFNHFKCIYYWIIFDFNLFKGGACHGFSSFAYSYQDNSAGTKLMNVDCS